MSKRYLDRTAVVLCKQKRFEFWQVLQPVRHLSPEIDAALRSGAHLLREVACHAEAAAKEESARGRNPASGGREGPYFATTDFCCRMISASARKEVFTARAFGNARATSGSSTITFVPCA